MCLDHTANRDLAAVTAARFFRKRSADPPPFEGGKPVERERMFASCVLLAELFAAALESSSPPSPLPALAGELPDGPAHANGYQAVDDLGQECEQE